MIFITYIIMALISAGLVFTKVSSFGTIVLILFWFIVVLSKKSHHQRNSNKISFEEAESILEEDFRINRINEDYICSPLYDHLPCNIHHKN